MVKKLRFFFSVTRVWRTSMRWKPESEYRLFEHLSGLAAFQIFCKWAAFPLFAYGKRPALFSVFAGEVKAISLCGLGILILLGCLGYLLHRTLPRALSHPQMAMGQNQRRLFFGGMARATLRFALDERLFGSSLDYQEIFLHSPF